MVTNKKLTIIDIIKLNHWLNARKITNQFINHKQKSLTKKLKKYFIEKLFKKIKLISYEI